MRAPARPGGGHLDGTQVAEIADGRDTRPDLIERVVAPARTWSDRSHRGWPNGRSGADPTLSAELLLVARAGAGAAPDDSAAG